MSLLGFIIAWGTTVPAMKEDLKELKAKVHDSPCVASLQMTGNINQELGRLDERVKGIEHKQNVI